MIQRGASPPEAIALDQRLALGGVAAWAAAAGVVVEARVEGVRAGGRPLPPGARRLLAPGERAEVEGMALWLEPRALDSTRALAGAVLAGLAPPPGPRLVAVEGPAAGALLLLRDSAVLGRGRGAELRVADPHASRRHARVTLEGSRVAVQDLASKNGFAVNGGALRRGRVELGPGDVLSIGATSLRLETGEPPACAPSPGAAADGPPPGEGPRRRVTPLLAAGALLVAAAALCAAAR
jgi:hypothetical protein